MRRIFTKRYLLLGLAAIVSLSACAPQKEQGSVNLDASEVFKALSTSPMSLVSGYGSPLQNYSFNDFCYVLHIIEEPMVAASGKAFPDNSACGLKFTPTDGQLGKFVGLLAPGSDAEVSVERGRTYIHLLGIHKTSAGLANCDGTFVANQDGSNGRTATEVLLANGTTIEIPDRAMLLIGNAHKVIQSGTNDVVLSKVTDDEYPSILGREYGGTCRGGNKLAETHVTTHILPYRNVSTAGTTPSGFRTQPAILVETSMDEYSKGDDNRRLHYRVAPQGDVFSDCSDVDTSPTYWRRFYPTSPKFFTVTQTTDPTPMTLIAHSEYMVTFCAASSESPSNWPRMSADFYVPGACDIYHSASGTINNALPIWDLNSNGTLTSGDDLDTDGVITACLSPTIQYTTGSATGVEISADTALVPDLALIGDVDYVNAPATKPLMKADTSFSIVGGILKFSTTLSVGGSDIELILSGLKFEKNHASATSSFRALNITDSDATGGSWDVLELRDLDFTVVGPSGAYGMSIDADTLGSATKVNRMENVKMNMTGEFLRGVGVGGGNVIERIKNLSIDMVTSNGTSAENAAGISITSPGVTVSEIRGLEISIRPTVSVPAARGVGIRISGSGSSSQINMVSGFRVSVVNGHAVHLTSGGASGGSINMSYGSVSTVGDNSSAILSDVSTSNDIGSLEDVLIMTNGDFSHGIEMLTGYFGSSSPIKSVSFVRGPWALATSDALAVFLDSALSSANALFDAEIAVCNMGVSWSTPTNTNVNAIDFFAIGASPTNIAGWSSYYAAGPTPIVTYAKIQDAENTSFYWDDVRVLRARFCKNGDN